MKNRKEDITLAFHQGSECRLQEKLGAHPVSRGWYRGVVFRVWAPHATAVSVIGEWNGWDPTLHPMKKIDEGGVWERFIPGVENYAMYKYAVTAADGSLLEKSDPCAYHFETRPGNASKVYSLPDFPWTDGEWMANRKSELTCSPVNIYELHAGSWRTYANGNLFEYEKLAEELVPYLKETGYNYVELMPLTEYPLDDSWGYQCTGYFAPTSRYGTPDGLMKLVDACHAAGIGVLLDWVPSHFPKNAEALARFDGEPCYEYRDPDKGEHRQWGTLVFDYGKNEVRSFLISSALFWLEKYHFDGLRVDAVASMLYLDYMRGPGEWKPNDRGGNDHAEAVSFLQALNAVVRHRVPSAVMIAEESTNWAGITDPAGLGFRMKWNMGWMNDLLAYTQADPVYRGAMHDKLTFQLTYAFSEKYILPISHDEVVHGKKSLLDKMPGDYRQKFAGLRLFLTYMYTQPGKKLLFMGTEWGQFIEWDYHKGLDWHLLDYPQHRMTHDFVRTLNRLYLDSPALWDDGGWDGFQWIDCEDVLGNTITYRRIFRGEELIVLCNFSNLPHEDYRIGVPEAGIYEEILSTDWEEWGGDGCRNGILPSEEIARHGFPQSLSLRVAPESAIVLRRVKNVPEDSARKE